MFLRSVLKHIFGGVGVRPESVSEICIKHLVVVVGV